MNNNIHKQVLVEIETNAHKRIGDTQEDKASIALDIIECVKNLRELIYELEL